MIYLVISVIILLIFICLILWKKGRYGRVKIKSPNKVVYKNGIPYESLPESLKEVVKNWIGSLIFVCMVILVIALHALIYLKIELVIFIFIIVGLIVIVYLYTKDIRERKWNEFYTKAITASLR